MRCGYVKIECIISQRASPRRENGLRTPAITLAKRQPLCAPRPRASGDRSAVGAGARGGGPAREPGGPALASPGPRARRGRRHPVGRLVQRYTLEVYMVRFTSGLLLCNRLLSPFERPRERRDRVTASQRSRALHKAGVTTQTLVGSAQPDSGLARLVAEI